MSQVKELVSGEVFETEDVKIVNLNLDQLKDDYSHSYFNTTYDGVIDAKILDDEKDNLEWHENNCNSTPFIVGDDCLYEAELIED